MKRWRRPSPELARRRLRRPPGHWLVLGVGLTVLVVMLAIEGITSRWIAAAGPPVTDARSGGLRSAFAVGAGPGRLRDVRRDGTRQIALTFDDGPDPVWTPRFAALLRRRRVPATFFLVGARVARHPEVVRDLHRDGFGLGNHTFTHVDLAGLPPWAARAQIDLTEAAISGAAGVRAPLLRPPGTATPESLGVRQAAALAPAAGRGSLIVLADLDGGDWRRRPAEEIMRAITPRAARGGVVRLHDAGPDPAATLRALHRVIPRLRARGFRFVSLSRLTGASRETIQPAATESQRVRGRILLATLWTSRIIVRALIALLLVGAALAVLRSVLLALLARHHVRELRAGPSARYQPPVSILVPAYNEAVGIEQAVRSLAGSDYADFEVIVVDDGSVDDTAEIVERLGLDRVRVLRQANAGKAAALNRGLSAVRHDIVVMVDADTVFEPDTVGRIVAPFADHAVGAASGNTKVGNRGGLLGRWQHIEYVMGFNLDRRLYDVLRCMPTVPGAIGAFRRAALDDVGGVSNATLAEDTDLTIAVGRAGWRVVYVEDARAWTEAPSTLGDLWRQRFRWSYGTMQAVWKHRSAVWHHGEQAIGRRGLPYLVCFQIALPSIAPLIDLFAVYGLVFLDPLPVLGYWLAFNALQLGLGFYAFRLDRESPRALWAMPLQQFVYRQLMYLVVLESLASALTGVRLRWHSLDRTGEVKVETARQNSAV
jgi:cellulose synthase/poly-beta-1,6-N-acetylglucosamine synthase-like glycosyltransferase/peptidoglycan/xylan/chitin deacetylase (PgdA/CDA1 family)